MLPSPQISIGVELREVLKLQYPLAYSALISASHLRARLFQYFYPLYSPDLLRMRPTPVVSPSQTTCNICQRGFQTVQNLNKHMGKVHSLAEKPEVCSLCSKKFKHKHALRFHFKQVHEMSTRANCNQCGKLFYNKYELLKHKRTRHYED